MEGRAAHLECGVLVCVGQQEIFGALNIIRQLGLRQVRSKLLQHLGCGFHRHGKVLYGLREKILVRAPPAAKAEALWLTVRWCIHWLWLYSRLPPSSPVSWPLSTYPWRSDREFSITICKTVPSRHPVGPHSPAG